MKYRTILFCLLFSSCAVAQVPEFQIEGKIFAAISVSNVESTSKWYEEVFSLKLLKEIKSEDGKVHIRVIGNDSLLFELLQNSDSKSLRSIGIDSPSKVHGYFKIGIQVKGIDELENYLRRLNIDVKYKFDDKEVGIRCLIISDNNGQMIQFFERQN